ncbi:hypothetical protein BCM14_2173 [Jezberella montanilacus]|uniref:Uncharacterized protein n=1 Tax=Jezberella montanilacus TaxID=323426 RepID=A0A2T0XFI6_9BURK|nr:hypothetical protein [Jezberella montanilacus]PRY97709.1 hypothetical protein BCM14_2173 [Jezberella montanilacus]
MSKNEAGLEALLLRVEYTKTQRRAAEKIFSMVLKEQGSDADLKQLVTRGSLLELIFLLIDHTKTVRARGAQRKSSLVASLAKAKAIKILYDWLDKNIHKYSGRLAACSEDATQIPGLGRGDSFVTKHIARYRKERGLR